MIMIYSADPETGALYTDEKRRFYIDSALLREKAAAARARFLLDKIAGAVGYKSFDSMSAALRCSGITDSTVEAWILSGTLSENLSRAISDSCEI